jgi:hypothetical protein
MSWLCTCPELANIAWAEPVEANTTDVLPSTSSLRQAQGAKMSWLCTCPELTAGNVVYLQASKRTSPLSLAQSSKY